MRDIDKIIELLQSGSGDPTQLIYLKNQYELFIEKDKYCWVKYNNPQWKNNTQNTYQKCYCCAKIKRPRYLFELCQYVLDYDGNSNIIIKREVRKWKKCPLLYISETLGTPDCCKIYMPVDNYTVEPENVFFGIYKPYFGDEKMEPQDLNKNIKDNIRRKTNGIDDSCHRFLCGFWRATTLQDLEISIKSELDEEHLRADLRNDTKKIKF